MYYFSLGLYSTLVHQTQCFIEMLVVHSMVICVSWVHLEPLTTGFHRLLYLLYLELGKKMSQGWPFVYREFVDGLAQSLIGAFLLMGTILLNNLQLSKEISTLIFGYLSFLGRYKL